MRHEGSSRKCGKYVSEFLFTRYAKVIGVIRCDCRNQAYFTVISCMHKADSVGSKNTGHEAKKG